MEKPSTIPIEKLVSEFLRGRDPLDIVVEINEIFSDRTERAMAHAALHDGVRYEISAVVNPKILKRIELAHGRKLAA